MSVRATPRASTVPLESVRTKTPPEDPSGVQQQRLRSPRQRSTRHRLRLENMPRMTRGKSPSDQRQGRHVRRPRQLTSTVSRGYFSFSNNHLQHSSPLARFSPFARNVPLPPSAQPHFQSLVVCSCSKHYPDDNSMHVRSFRAHEVTYVASTPCQRPRQSSTHRCPCQSLSSCWSLLVCQRYDLETSVDVVSASFMQVGDDVNTADTDYSDHSSRSKERINHSQLGDTGSKFHVADMAPILPEVQKLIWTERVENARTEFLLSSDSIEDIET